MPSENPSSIVSFSELLDYVQVRSGKDFRKIEPDLRALYETVRSRSDELRSKGEDGFRAWIGDYYDFPRTVRQAVIQYFVEEIDFAAPKAEQAIQSVRARTASFLRVVK